MGRARLKFKGLNDEWCAIMRCNTASTYCALLAGLWSDISFFINDQTPVGFSVIPAIKSRYKFHDIPFPLVPKLRPTPYSAFCYFSKLKNVIIEYNHLLR